QLNDDLYDTDTGIPVDENGEVVPGMNPETRYNDPQDYLKHKRTDLQLRYTHKFRSKLIATNLTSWSFDDIDYLSTEWLYFNEAQDSITRGFPFYFNHVTKPLQNQLDFTYRFKTGKIEHKSVIGHSFSYLDRKTYRGDVIGEGTFTTVAVNDPILNQGHIEAVDNRVQVKEEIVNGFYFQDWINLSSKLKALIGVRYDLFSGVYYTNEIDNNRNLLAKGEETSIPSTALTYRGGVVYQPIEKMSIFGSYSNYFKPSRRIGVNGEVFDPETGYQVEGGIKLIQENKISLTLSGFYLLKNNIVERTTVDDFQQIGTADSKGVELDVVVEPVKGMYIKAGYTYTDARIRTADIDTLQVIKAGNKLAYAPDHMANLWVNYEVQTSFLKGLGIGAGMNVVSENYTSANNQFKLPGYFTLDGTVYYQKDKVRVGFNANNLLDQLYYTDAIYGNQFFPGQGRNFRLSLGYRF
ncbi:MAG: TonB-dependent receptor, partial [Crocinitomicaceae bacterium]|nr:TonB-dependent receptor [Crocinitomicaceae bacterium]